MNVNTNYSSVVYTVLRNEYSYFKGGYLQRVFLITVLKMQAHIIVGHYARMMLATLW